MATPSSRKTQVDDLRLHPLPGRAFRRNVPREEAEKASVPIAACAVSWISARAGSSPGRAARPAVASSGTWSILPTFARCSPCRTAPVAARAFACRARDAREPVDRPAKAALRADNRQRTCLAGRASPRGSGHHGRLPRPEMGSSRVAPSGLKSDGPDARGTGCARRSRSDLSGNILPGLRIAAQAGRVSRGGRRAGAATRGHTGEATGSYAWRRSLWSSGLSGAWHIRGGKSRPYIERISAAARCRSPTRPKDGNARFGARSAIPRDALHGRRAPPMRRQSRSGGSGS